jgi:hypothetical protein
MGEDETPRKALCRILSSDVNAQRILCHHVGVSIASVYQATLALPPASSPYGQQRFAPSEAINLGTVEIGLDAFSFSLYISNGLPDPLLVCVCV